MGTHEPAGQALELEQNIVIYLNRKQTIVNAWFWIGSWLSLGLAWMFILIIHFTIGGLVVPLICFFIVFTLFGIATYHRISLMFHIRDPRLVINHQGIQIGKQSLLIGCLFISWDEIGKISSNRFHSDIYFCIYPQEIGEYLSHFSFWKRFLIRINSVMDAPLNLSQDELDTSIDQIFHQLSYKYGDKIISYAIDFAI